jgi:carboxyl-terminal processing protease
MEKSVRTPRGLGYSLAIGALIGTCTALIFTAGFLFRDIAGGNMSVLAAGGNDDYQLLIEVQTLLDHHYLREQPDDAARQYAAIRGVLGALEDRYTFFIDPPVAQSESDALAGTYGGIGVQVQRDEAGQFVLFPFEDSPAGAAGISENDVLTAINGEVLNLSTQQDVVDQMLRGEVKDGNGVELTVIKASGEEFTAFIEFAVINVPSVVWRVLQDDERIGYLQIIRFTGRTPEELTNALTDLKTSEVSALILDLRNNSGGLLQESIDVASQFIPANDVIVYEKSKDSERSFNAAENGLATEIPMIVLINQGTASASELVAGAIQDHDRGILVGQQTFGKGTVQQIFRLSDSSSIHITSAEWLTPNRRQLESIGLEPNVAMIPDVNGRDVELGEALRYLQQNFDLG